MKRQKVTAEERYHSAIDTMHSEIAKHEDEEDVSVDDVLVKAGVLDRRLVDYEEFKYVDFVRADGLWNVFARKVPLDVHGMVGHQFTRQLDRWLVANGDALGDLAGFKALVTTPGIKDLAVEGRLKQVDVDWALGMAVPPQHFCVILEHEVKNKNLLEMNKRGLGYIKAWQDLQVAILIKLFDWRQNGTFVAIAFVWRRAPDLLPRLDRVFDIGSCNHDHRQSRQLTSTRDWLKALLDNGEITSAVDVEHVDYVTPVPPGLPVPLPDIPSIRTAVPENPALQKHFQVAISHAELLHNTSVDLDDPALLDIPDFTINLYHVLLWYNIYDETWARWRASS